MQMEPRGLRGWPKGNWLMLELWPEQFPTSQPWPATVEEEGTTEFWGKQGFALFFTQFNFEVEIVKFYTEPFKRSSTQILLMQMATTILCHHPLRALLFLPPRCWLANGGLQTCQCTQVTQLASGRADIWTLIYLAWTQAPQYQDTWPKTLS